MDAHNFPVKCLIFFLVTDVWEIFCLVSILLL